MYKTSLLPLLVASAFFLGMGAHAEEMSCISYEDICATFKPGAPPMPEARKNRLLLYVAKGAGIVCMDGEQYGVVKLLLEAGADPNAVDSESKGREQSTRCRRMPHQVSS